MELNTNPAKPVRTIVTAEGKFLSLEDMKRELLRDDVMDLALAMLVIGRDRGDSPREIFRHVIGGFICDCANERQKALDSRSESNG